MDDSGSPQGVDDSGICILYKWNYWRVECLAIYSNTTVGGILNWQISVLSERNPYKRFNNGIQLTWRSFQDSPNHQIKITVNISACTVYAWLHVYNLDRLSL